ncbi:hypothetical protein MNBD_DELTA04-21 [hydrothermal vent metagenome]|uniref:TolA protein n=1 Tax=hydrothermal vent metagenome TaxID=652676 RepID=A0A3B0VT41_9ZZZZ
MSLSDTAFFLRQEDADRRWLWPVGLAVIFHIVVFALSATLPSLIHRRPLLNEVITVNLVALPKLAAKRPAAARPRRPVPEKRAKPVARAKPVKAEIQVARRQPAKVAVKALPAKPISLRPLSRKIKVAVNTRRLEEHRRRQQEKRERAKALAAARRDEKLAELDAVKARKALADMLRDTGALENSQPRRASAGRQQIQSIVFRQYLASLDNKIRQLWVLPDMRQWRHGLEMVVVLTIRRDGTVTNTYIEKKSQDPFFDQFVMKTIQSVAAMPHFPPLMRQKSIEVGLRFRPGELVTAN